MWRVGQRAVWGRDAKGLMALFGLSLLGTVRALRGEMLPEGWLPAVSPELERLSGWVIFSLLAGAHALRRGGGWPDRRRAARAVLVGLLVGLLLVPMAGMGRARDVSLLALIPFLCLELRPHFRLADGRAGNGHRVAALACFGGAALVYPLPRFSTLSDGVAVGLALLAVGSLAGLSCLAAVELNGAGKRERGSFVAIASVTATLAQMLMWSVKAEFFVRAAKPGWPMHSAHGWWPTWALWTVCEELPAVWLLWWVVARLSAAQAATRFVIGPLLTVVVGTLLAQAGLSAEAWFGLAMMGAGSGVLLLARDEPEEPQRLALEDDVSGAESSSTLGSISGKWGSGK